MDVSFRDWAGLPAHIADILVIKLDQFYDFLRFCGVCSKWRCVALEANVDHRRNLDVFKASRKKLPMLLFSTDELNNELRGLYCVSSGKIYTVKLPVPSKYRVSGSSCGWLFFVEENMGVNLVNPFKNGCISLPVLEDPPLRYENYFDYYIQKGIILSDPSVNPDSFGVVVLYSCMGKLAFFNSRGSCWNLIKSELQISDIIYYKDKLYAVCHWGEFVEINLDDRTIKTLIRATEICPFVRIYLIESQDGELLMVQKSWYYDDDDSDDDDYVLGRIYEFNVFKMTRLTEESPTWVEVRNIGEQALFVGYNHSVSVSTSNFPGCIPNSIYYTNEHDPDIPTYDGSKDDSGIFDLETRRSCYRLVLDSSDKYAHPPIWFLPNP